MSNNASVAEVATLLIPVDGKTLLIPNVTVAEVMSYSAPEKVKGKLPEWYLGVLNWRNQKIPMLSFEGLNGAGVSTETGEETLCIINGVGEKLPFYALVTQGAPRLMRVDAETFTQQQKGALGDVEAMKVEGANITAVIPDFDKIEKLISKIL